MIRQPLPPDRQIQRRKKLLWAVDPFADERALQRSVAWAIRAITGEQPATIEPIYFFSEYLMDGTEVSRNLLEHIKKDGQRKLDIIVKPVGLHGLRPLHVLAEPNIALREGVEKITWIGKKWNADLVVSGTRSRKGMQRFWAGSFAETLVLYSDVPLLLVNPHWKRRSTFKQILFATDFSRESEAAFQKVLSFASSLGSEITLFHKLKCPWPPGEYADLGIYAKACRDDLLWKRDIASKWARLAADSGVSARVEIDERTGDSIVDAIMEYARRRPGLIAMAAHSGPAKSVLLGSTTRKVLRASPYPVWVLHPQLAAEAQAEPGAQPLHAISESA